jgi:hypothetical protein
MDPTDPADLLHFCDLFGSRDKLRTQTCAARPDVDHNGDNGDITWGYNGGMMKRQWIIMVGENWI